MNLRAESFIRGGGISTLTRAGTEFSVSEEMSEPLKLYVKTWCPWCIMATRFLREHGYDFDEIDVEADRSAYAEMIKLSGQSYTPTLEVGGKVLADFGPEDLEEFLRENDIKVA